MPYTGGRRANQQPASKRKPSMSETRSYLYKGCTPIARSAAGSYGLHVSAYGHDALGSVAATVSQGSLEERYRYDAFGGNYEGKLETDERGYNGKPHDPVTGLYNYGYRDYDPVTGRFSTVDPIRDGRNWYVYVGNDPVNYIDAWGLEAEDGDVSSYPVDGYNVFATVAGTYKGGKWNNTSLKHGPGAGLGYYESVRTEDGAWYNYGHLDPKYAPKDMAYGDEVHKGDFLGRIANPTNGNSDGPHVHVQKNVKNPATGDWEMPDPGEANPLGIAGYETAGYPKYPDGGYHNGRDFAPTAEYRK